MLYLADMLRKTKISPCSWCGGDMQRIIEVIKPHVYVEKCNMCSTELFGGDFGVPGQSEITEQLLWGREDYEKWTERQYRNLVRRILLSMRKKSK